MKPIAKDSVFYKEVTEDELEKINARLNSMDYETLKDPGMWVNLYTEDQFLFDIIFLYIVFLRMNLDPPSTTTGNKKGWILSTRRNFSPNNPIFTMDNLRVLLSMMHMVRNIRIGQDLQEMMVLKQLSCVGGSFWNWQIYPEEVFAKDDGVCQDGHHKTSKRNIGTK